MSVQQQAVSSGAPGATSSQAASEELRSVFTDFERAYQRLTALEAAMRVQADELRAEHKLGEERRAELHAMEAEFARRAEEIDRQSAECAAAAQKLETGRDELAARQAEFGQKIEAVAKSESTLAQREGQIAQREAAVAERERSIETREQELESARATFAEQQGALAAQQRELDEQQLAVLAAQEEVERGRQQLQALDDAITQREHALASFQQSFAQMAQMFGASGAIPGMGSAQELHAAIRSVVEPRHEGASQSGGDGVAPWGSHSAAASPVTEAEPESDAPAAMRPAPSAALEAVGNGHASHAGDSTESDSVDTVDFTPEEVEKLRVLRRLSGGSLSDGQLVARIRAERSGGAAGSSDASRSKSKRGWWK